MEPRRNHRKFWKDKGEMGRMRKDGTQGVEPYHRKKTHWSDLIDDEDDELAIPEPKTNESDDGQ